MSESLEQIRFDDRGLVPAVIQDASTGEILMLAWMNRESLEKTISTKTTWFYSRSRKELWNKGATSGATQHVSAITYDCDGDALVVTVTPDGPACHTGERTCFFNALSIS